MNMPLKPQSSKASSKMGSSSSHKELQLYPMESIEDSWNTWGDMNAVPQHDSLPLWPPPEALSPSVFISTSSTVSLPIPSSSTAVLQLGPPVGPIRHSPTRHRTSLPSSPPSASRPERSLEISQETIDRLKHELNIHYSQPLTLESVQDPGPEQRPVNLVALTQVAILSSQNQQLKLQEIYSALAERFEFFRANSGEKAPWKGSIRHMLSLHKEFVQVDRKERGRGRPWVVTGLTGYTRQRHRSGRGGRRGSTSSPGSPSIPEPLPPVREVESTTEPLEYLPFPLDVPFPPDIVNTIQFQPEWYSDTTYDSFSSTPSDGSFEEASFDWNSPLDSSSHMDFSPLSGNLDTWMV
ncbi:hypothetical protein DL96DRAFT_1589513 [Flagelloscypha sp. PMI_526]|nr:hypothetical protein DL96DRAFT_1589513 [Flagelloscypha sp. PMI_526]